MSRPRDLDKYTTVLRAAEALRGLADRLEQEYVPTGMLVKFSIQFTFWPGALPETSATPQGQESSDR